MFKNLFNTPQFNMLDFDKINTLTMQNNANNNDQTDLLQQNEYICKGCGFDLYMVQKFIISCNNCGLINYIESLQFVHQINYNATSQFIYKTPEQKQLEFDMKIDNIDDELKEAMNSQNIEQKIQEDLILYCNKEIAKSTSKHQLVLKYSFVCLIIDKCGQDNISIDRLAICKSLNIKPSKIKQYAKRIQQQQYYNFDTPKPQFDQYQTTKYEVIVQKFQDFGVANIIYSYLDDKDNKNPLRLNNTTNSMVFEITDINNIRWNNIQIYNRFLDKQNTYKIPSNLIQIKGRFIFIDFRANPPVYKMGLNDAKSQMNMAITFVFQSYINPEKVYKIKCFQQGKIQVPGVLKQYEYSELQIIIQKLIGLLKQMFVCQIDSTKINRNVILRNFTSNLFIGDDKNIDIMQTFNYLKQENIYQELQDIAIQFKTCILDIKVQSHRLYFNFIIPKNLLQYTKENFKSTANQKQGKTIQFILTQSGIFSIQGATDHQITMSITKLFIILYQKYISKLVYNKVKQTIFKKVKQTNNTIVEEFKCDSDQQNQFCKRDAGHVLQTLSDQLNNQQNLQINSFSVFNDSYYKNVQIILPSITDQEIDIVKQLINYLEQRHLISQFGLQIRCRLLAFFIEFNRLYQQGLPEPQHNEKHVNGKKKSIFKICYGCFTDLKTKHSVKIVNINSIICALQLFNNQYMKASLEHLYFISQNKCKTIQDLKSQGILSKPRNSLKKEKLLKDNINDQQF